jgi:hypothetical protein
MHRLLLVAALLLTAFAGCLDDSGEPAGDDPLPGTGGGPLYQGAGTLFAGPALYRDPQNAPHPSFNFATLANPAGIAAPAHWRPITPGDLPERIEGLAHVAQTPGVASGAGTALFGSIAVVPGYGQPTAVVDISDPMSPKVLSTFEPQEGMSNHRGAAFIPYPDGHLSVLISTGSGIDHWDLTDPTNPQPLPFLEPEGGSHKVGIIPGTPIVVNAASDGGSPNNPATSPTVSQMWDLSDRDAPIQLPDFRNGYGCHHVYFWNDVEQEKYRGVCAGIEYTQIWDTTDPYNPTVIVSVPFGTGGTPAGAAASGASVSFSHYAGLSMDGSILMVGDEHGGGAGPIGCVAAVDTPAGRVSVPIGAVWFYDVSDETDPQLLSWVSMSQLEKQGLQNPTNTAGVPASCTAHHGRLVPVEGRDVLAMSFYGAGVVVIDFTAIRDGTSFPEVVAQYKDGSDTWETWYYNGWLFTGDLNRGMDVLALE